MNENESICTRTRLRALKLVPAGAYVSVFRTSIAHFNGVTESYIRITVTGSPDFTGATPEEALGKLADAKLLGGELDGAEVAIVAGAEC